MNSQTLEAKTGYSAKTPKILIVDDEPHMVKSLHRMTRKWGYEVSSAGSGFRAALLLENRMPDIVLLTLKCPI